MKFIADHMLGRLAKWLRILGFDTLFLTNVPDQEILKKAQAENRTLLTRDRELAERALPGKSLLIQSGSYTEQLKEVVDAFQLKWKPERLFSICLDCNEPVRKADKRKLSQLVPNSVLKRHDHFWKCPACEKIFWKGSHYENTERKLNRIGIFDG